MTLENLLMNNKESQIIVLGAGGHGKTIVSVIQASGYSAFGILDDDSETWGKQILGITVLGAIDKIREYPDYGVVMGFGDNTKRKKIALEYPDLNWVTIRSTSAYINPTAKIGLGCVVFANAVIGADVSIGDHSIASANITIGHDSVIEDYVHIAPGVQIAGGTYTETGVMLGMGSIVCPEVRIGKNTVLGAGAVAVKDLPADSVAFGMPAKTKNKD